MPKLRLARASCCSARPSPAGRRRRTRARMCEPRLGILIQGRIKNLGLSTTRGRFFSRSCRVHSMKRVARGELPRGCAEADHGHAASRCGRERRSASGRRPGSCNRDSGSGRRTRSRACPHGCRARRVRRSSGRTSSRVVGGGNSGGSVSGPKTMGLGRPWRHLGRRQLDEAVVVHGQHGDAGHHVLEAAVGLEPADASAELLRQGMSGEPLGGPVIRARSSAICPQR